MEVKSSLSSKISSVKVYLNGAVITRTFMASLPAGSHRLVLDNLESDIDEASIRISLKPSGTVRSVAYDVYERPVSEILGEDEAKLLEELRSLRKRRDNLTLKIAGIEKYIATMDRSLPLALLAYLVSSFSARNGDVDVSGSIQKLMKGREGAAEKLVNLRFQLEELEARIKELEGRLKRLKENTVKVGRLTIHTGELAEGEYAFTVSYAVRSVRWRPFYDIMIEGGKAKLLAYAEIVQKTNQAWSGVDLHVYSKKIAPVSKPEPSPWYVSLYKPRPAAMAMRAKAAAPAVEYAEEEVEEEEKLAFEKLEEVEVGGYVSYRAREPVTLEPDVPFQVLLSESELSGDRKVIWDAFTNSPPVEVFSFKNTGGTISPGEARIYVDGVFVGRTMLRLIAPGQEVELALTEADRLETERKLVVHEESKGLIGGKAYLKRGYRLKLVNHYPDRIKAVVYDRVPVAGDPEIKVELNKAEPRPAEVTTGILKWELEIAEGDSAELIYAYTISYPREAELTL